MSRSIRPSSMWWIKGKILVLFLFHLRLFVVVLAAPKGSDSIQELLSLDYSKRSDYPLRTKEEAAVLEWGHSALITALDASVAHFGPQTSQAALLEVEAMPILASPINGVRSSNAEDEEEDGEDDNSNKIRPLDNADQVHGNMVVMTNRNDLTGVEMAQIAQASGAAALLVVNVDEDHPEDIFRLPIAHQAGAAEEIQIPVVMISLNSANAITTATVTAATKKRNIVNNGMPERVRLYAGGDRPFFEDVEPQDPTVYLIHNLLTDDECNSLIRQAERRLSSVSKPDILQLTTDVSKYHNVDRVMLWQGMLQSPARKQVEERIEQVTGFPSDHFSDFIIDRYEEGSYWSSHYDTVTGDPNNVPLATITVFLSDDTGGGGHMVFPSTHSDPIKIRPIKGLAVVHHNTDEQQQFDVNAVHAHLPASGTLYVGTKYIFAAPVSKARRIALPVYAMPFGGKLPDVVVRVHELFVEKFGHEQGGSYFDKLCVFLPMLLILSLAQWIVEYVSKQFKGSSSSSKAATTATATSRRPTADSKDPKKRSKTDKKKN